jgi:hypothetical protein
MNINFFSNLLNMDEGEEDSIIWKVLRESKTIAVVGCSREEGKDSHNIPMYLQKVGYRIIPINPFATEILGEKAYAKLSDVKEKIDVVDVFRPSAEAVEIAKEAVSVHAKVLWLQEGIISEEAKKIAEENGLLFVMNRCMFKEHYKRRLEL